MRIYLVGGYVRDLYLTRELGYPKGNGDRDWVVVGATPQQMLQMGFKQVGKDFPVFLHPKTHEEYALARTERKVAPGYHGFVFNTSSEVSLEDDLKRRDLTINAMALDGETLIDPYGGLDDIRAKQLRHVSESFKEDPVRILRIARFNAKLPQFSVASDTLLMLKEMVDNGEADSLVAERVFLEMKKVLRENKPSRFVEVLNACGLWSRFFHNFPVNRETLQLLDQARELNEAEKFALLTHDENRTDQLKAFLNTFKPNAEITDTVYLWAKVKREFQNTDPQHVLKLIETCDAVRRPERLEKMLHLAEVIFNVDTHPWKEALNRISAIDCAKIAASCADKLFIGNAIRQARLTAIEEISQNALVH